MRTREDILAYNPQPFDIIVWVPCSTCEGRRIKWAKDQAIPCDCQFGGRFERHATPDTLPMSADVSYPTDAADLMEILPALSIMDLSFLCLRYSYRRLTRSISERAPDWKRAWTYLRRHMPMTIADALSAGSPPRSKDLHPKPIHIASESTRRVRGESKPIVGVNGVQTFHVLYKPNDIEARDLAFMLLEPIQQAVMRALLDLKKTVVTRSEVYSALSKSKWLETYPDPWMAWTRARPKLIQGKFVGEEYPPGIQSRKGVSGLRPVTVRQQRNRAA